MERVVADWLSLLEVKVSKKYLRHQLRSHPDFPSMLSITETLSFLNIDSAALVLEKESVQDFPVPFLIHVDRSGGEFILIRDVEELLNDKQLLENWSGIVVAAQKPQLWNHMVEERQKSISNSNWWHSMSCNCCNNFVAPELLN